MARTNAKLSRRAQAARTSIRNAPRMRIQREAQASPSKPKQAQPKPERELRDVLLSLIVREADPARLYFYLPLLLSISLLATAAELHAFESHASNRMPSSRANLQPATCYMLPATCFMLPAACRSASKQFCCRT